MICAHSRCCPLCRLTDTNTNTKSHTNDQWLVMIPFIHAAAHCVIWPMLASWISPVSPVSPTAPPVFRSSTSFHRPCPQLIHSLCHQGYHHGFCHLLQVLPYNCKCCHLLQAWQHPGCAHTMLDLIVILTIFNQIKMIACFLLNAQVVHKCTGHYLV